ncbi:MAG TPA: isochorismatase family protein [Acidimicrobiia bacterium]|nr:isochorismatase family protein [Acidimicrobiia bacterium]
MTDFDATTALVVVDCQNDFTDPEGSLFVPGSEAVIDEVNRHVAAAVAAGSPVIYTQDWHPPSTPHFEKDGGIWPVHCVAGSWGAEFHPGLVVGGPTIRKGSNGEDGYSGFTMRDPESGADTPTELHSMLQAHGASQLVVVGVALDYCVKGTALDGLELGYSVTMPLEATAAVNLQPSDGAAAAEEAAEAGATVV